MLAQIEYSAPSELELNESCVATSYLMPEGLSTRKTVLKRDLGDLNTINDTADWRKNLVKHIVLPKQYRGVDDTLL